jgi:hypothetical protein
VDVYAAIEQNRLKYLRLNKKKLRMDLYQGLEDAINAGDNSVAAIGQRIILPSSFTIGPCQCKALKWVKTNSAPPRITLTSPHGKWDDCDITFTIRMTIKKRKLECI